jgi:hypothetical protein
MQLTNVYIDGFNLYYGALKDTPYKWLDLDALCRRLLPKHRIGRIRYFTAIVSARPNDPSGPDRQRTYLRAYLLADAFRQDCEAVVVITNDSDLKEPIRVVRSELGLPVGVVKSSRSTKAKSSAARCDLLQATATIDPGGMPAPGGPHRPPRHDFQAAALVSRKSRGPAVARPRTQPANRLGGYSHRVQRTQRARTCKCGLHANDRLSCALLE